MCFYDFTQRINTQVEEYIKANMTEVKAEELRIDPRAAYRIWMSDSEIAIPRSIKGTFDYYAGGEYVGKGSVHVLGEYVFYDSEDPRVAEWIFAARDTPEDAEEAEEDELGDWNDVSSKHHY